MSNNFIMILKAKRRRLLLIIFISLLILYFALNSYLLKLDEESYRELLHSLKTIARRTHNTSKTLGDIYGCSMPPPLPVVASGEWIVNPRVAQYGAYLKLYDRCIELETLTLFDYAFTSEMYIRSRVKLVVRLADEEFAIANIERTFRRKLFSGEDNSLRYMWQLTTSVNLNSSGYRGDIDKIAVAVIDVDELQQLIRAQQQNSGSVTNLNSLIVFHKPVVLVDSPSLPIKKKAVAHCVHMLRSLNNVRLGWLYDWLRLQKSVGYDKIRLYTFQVSNVTIENIRSFDPDLIEINVVDIDFKTICKYQIYISTKGI